MTDAKAWVSAKDAIVSNGIKSGDFFTESYLRTLFGIPNDGAMRSEDAVNERNLFFTVQFNYLRNFFLTEHKLLIDRERGKSGFTVVEPKDHARRTSRKSIVTIKREMARASFSIKNVDINSIAEEDRQKVLDDIERFNRFSTAVRGDAKDFRKMGTKMLATSAGSSPMFIKTEEVQVVTN